MSATNTTPNIGLPSFIGTDKPSWLTDWNGAMSTIDSEVGGLKTDLSGDETRIGNLENSVSSLNTTVGNHTTSITALNTQVSNQGGTINTITSLIGNGTPTTTDQTIIGAINELHADITDKYVIKERRRKISSASADGVKTFQTLMQEAVVAAIAFMQTMEPDGKEIASLARVKGGNYIIPGNLTAFWGSDVTSIAQSVFMYSGHGVIDCLALSSTLSYNDMYSFDMTTNTATNHTTDIPTSGTTFEVYVDIYERID